MFLASPLSTTMAVKKDLSIVADSTCSPCPSSPTFKQRASPTYDYSKMSDDTKTSLIYPPSSSASRDSTCRAGPPDLDEQVPPSSDLFHSFSDNEPADDENEDSPNDASCGISSGGGNGCGNMISKITSRRPFQSHRTRCLRWPLNFRRLSLCCVFHTTPLL